MNGLWVDDIKTVLITVLIVLVFFIAAVFGGNAYGDWKCNTFATLNPHLTIQYRQFAGCFVRLPSGTWVGSEFVSQYEPIQLKDAK